MLKLQKHVVQITPGDYCHLHNIRKIRKYLTLATTRCLVHALVKGRVDYCNSLLYGLPKTNINNLQRLQVSNKYSAVLSDHTCTVSVVLVTNRYQH